MIPREVIQNYIQEKIGLYAFVSIDGAINVLETKPTMNLFFNRTPYYADKNTEAIGLRIELDVNLTTDRDREQLDDKLGQLFDDVNGVLVTTTYNTVIYKYKVYLQSFEPIGTRADTGKRKTIYSITGTMVATSSGSVFANDIEIQLSDSTTNHTKPILIKFMCDYSVPSDIGQQINTLEMVPYPQGVSRTFAIVMLADNSAVSKAIEKQALGIVQDSLTQTYSMKLKASDGTEVTKTLSLISCTFDASTGGFAVITAVFRRARL